MSVRCDPKLINDRYYVEVQHGATVKRHCPHVVLLSFEYFCVWCWAVVERPGRSSRRVPIKFVACVISLEMRSLRAGIPIVRKL